MNANHVDGSVFARSKWIRVENLGDVGTIGDLNVNGRGRILPHDNRSKQDKSSMQKRSVVPTDGPAPNGPGKVNILLSEEQIRLGVTRLANQLRDQYGKQPVTIIGIMTGSIMLLADLIRMLEMPLRVGVIQTSSYRESMTRGKLTINSDMLPDIRDRDVLVIDDIFDTGHTMTEVLQMIDDMKPKSLRSAVLLCKTGRQQVDLRPDFVMFDIPDEFVVGYGLDYCDEYRNLPYIAALDASEFVTPKIDDP